MEPTQYSIQPNIVLFWIVHTNTYNRFLQRTCTGVHVNAARLLNFVNGESAVDIVTANYDFNASTSFIDVV